MFTYLQPNENAMMQMKIYVHFPFASQLASLVEFLIKNIALI